MPQPNSTETHLHTPTSFCYYIVTRNALDEVSYRPVIYRGPNASKMFWRKIHEEAWNISRKIALTSQGMIIDQAEARKIQNTPNPICHLCKKPIDNRKDLVLDHNHLSKNLRPPGEKPSNI